MAPETEEKQAMDRERFALLQQVEEWFELPVMILGFVWLILFIIDLLNGLTPLLDTALTAIWAIFILDFAIRLILAPRKLVYLKQNWLTAISLLLPFTRALRLARTFRVLTSIRGVRLVQVLGSINRGMSSLRKSMAKRGFGYVVALTGIMTLVGAAGMYAFENTHGLKTYPQALWWTAMIMTTLGSDYWPVTPPGRVLTFLLALYAFGVFGYTTAALASFFIAPPAQEDSSASIADLKAQVETLSAEVRSLTRQISDPPAEKSQDK